MVTRPIVLFVAAIVAVLGIAFAASAGIGSSAGGETGSSSTGERFDAAYPNSIDPCDLLDHGAKINDAVNVALLVGERETNPSGTKICSYQAQGAPSVYVNVSVGDIETFENEMTMFINFYSPLPGNWDRGYILCQQMCHAHFLKDQTYISVVLNGNALSQDPEASLMTYINDIADELE